MNRVLVTVAAVASVALPVWVNAATVDIVEQIRVDRGEAPLPPLSSAVTISENSIGGIGGNDPGSGPSDFTSVPGADTNFTFYGYMEGDKDSFRFGFSSAFTAALDLFEFHSESSNVIVNFQMREVGASGFVLDETVSTDGATSDFGTFASGTYDFFIDGDTNTGSGNAVDYDVNFAAVPLPAAGWAMLAALGGLAAVGRRLRN